MFSSMLRTRGFLSHPPAQRSGLNLGDTPRPPAEGLRPSALPAFQHRSSLPRLILLTASACVVAVACGGGGSEPPTAAQICGATPDVPAIVNSSELVEASGLASSRADENFLWAHNDSGDTARAFAIDRQGNHHGTYTLAGADAIDWEDMAVGPGPEDGVSYLYLADIGDNAMQREQVIVYRVPEPEVPTRADTPSDDSPLDQVETLTLVYPDRPHDAETLLVDPETGDLLIVTKELAGGPSSVFQTSGTLEDGSATQLELVIEIDFPSFVSSVEVPDDAPPIVRAVPNLPTGGDVSPDGGLVIVRTYGSVWVWAHSDEATPLWTVFAAAPCEAPSAIEEQGETIAFDADGRGYTTVSEGERPAVHHFSAGED